MNKVNYKKVKGVIKQNCEILSELNTKIIMLKSFINEYFLVKWQNFENVDFNEKEALMLYKKISHFLELTNIKSKLIHLNDDLNHVNNLIQKQLLNSLEKTLRKAA